MILQKNSSFSNFSDVELIKRELSIMYSAEVDFYIKETPKEHKREYNLDIRINGVKDDGNNCVTIHETHSLCEEPKELDTLIVNLIIPSGSKLTFEKFSFMGIFISWFKSYIRTSGCKTITKKSAKNKIIKISMDIKQ